MARKLILGGSAAYLVLLWALCAAIYVIKSRSGVYGGGALAPFTFFGALFTVAAVSLQTRAWRREAGLVAAALTSLVAAATVLVLLFLLAVGGG